MVNDSGQARVVDGYDFVEASPGLVVDAAGLLPYGPAQQIGPTAAPAPEAARQTIAALPLVGATIEPSTTPGWTQGAWLAFLIRVPATAGEYAIDSVRLRYHVGGQTFTAVEQGGVDICVGASMSPGGSCPLPAVTMAPSSTSPAGSPPASVGTARASVSPLPSGGISEARAITLARGHSSLSTFVSATAGRFADLNIQPTIGPDYPITPEHMVWAVRFNGEESICNPLGVCFSPRPGITVVYLDFASGAFLSAQGVSPAP